MTESSLARATERFLGPREAVAAFGRRVSASFGGALLFSLPLLMTMEMWWLGFHMPRGRLALLMVLSFLLLVPLERAFGLRRRRPWVAATRGAVVATGIGFVTSLVILWALGVLQPPLALDEAIGKVAVQAVPAGLGAVVGAAQFGGTHREREERRARAGYGTHLFFTLAGAVYLAITVAPTEEMILIAFKMTYAHALALGALSLALMYAVLYLVQFPRRHHVPSGTPWWSVFLRFTVVGYAIALAVSALVLWLFGRYGGGWYGQMVVEAMVLAFPGSLGAAGARLLL